MTLTEKVVKTYLKNSIGQTMTSGKRCIIFYYGGLPLRKPNWNVKLIVANCATWQEAYVDVKDRQDLKRAKSIDFKPQNPVYKSPHCFDAFRLSDYLKIYCQQQTEVVEHDNEYFVVPVEQPDLFNLK